MAEPIVVPDRLNMATWFLDARVTEGLGDQVAAYYHPGPDDQARPVTYGELSRRSHQVTNLLRALGLRIEERVLLLLLDTPEFIETYFGVLRAGGVAVPANTWLRTEDYAYYLEYARPRIVVVDATVWPTLAPALASAPHTDHVIVVARGDAQMPAGLPTSASASATASATASSSASATASSSASSSASRSINLVDYRARVPEQPTEAVTEPTYRDDFATWLSSSGSTGKPKCVVHMHHDFVWNTIAYAQRTLKLGPRDITLSAPKLFFGYALASNMLFPFSVGGRCVLTPQRLQPAEYFELVERYRATQLVTVPTNIAKLMEVDTTGRDLGSLRSLVSAGEALPPRLYRDWKERFGVEIYDGIGSAEMFHVYITNRPGDVKEGSLGRIVEGYRYRLLGDDGNEVGPGEIGTLVIEGPSAGAGYWRMRDKSRETFWGDAVKGGDKFHVDQDGYFWYCGRGDDMLKCSGVYVSPVEVENCLLGHPAVHEAGVVGYRDAAGLEKAMAFVELASGHVRSEALEREIVQWARGQIAAFKAPRRVRIVDALPRTETGKIRRAALRELAKAAGVDEGDDEDEGTGAGTGEGTGKSKGSEA